MALNTKKFNEIIVQILYALEHSGEHEGLIPLMMEEVKTTKNVVKEAYTKALEIWQVKESLDLQIATLSHAYHIDRIGDVEKGILRLLFFQGCTPHHLEEALRLAKKFSSDSAASFVHALSSATHEPAVCA